MENSTPFLKIGCKEHVYNLIHTNTLNGLTQGQIQKQSTYNARTIRDSVRELLINDKISFTLCQCGCAKIYRVKK